MRRLLRESSDLITALALTLFFMLIVTTFPDWQNIIRAGFGAIVMLFTPGYLLTLLLFPAKEGIDVAERTALTLALSAITIIGTGLVLNYLPVGIQAGSIAVGLSVTNTMFAVLAGLQRARLEPARRFLLPPALGFRRLLMGVAGFVVVVALFNAVIPQDRFTEFYLLGPSGQLDDYPRYLQPGEAFRMRLGITNLEGNPQTYRVRLPASDVSDTDTFIDVPQLEHEETWETPVTLYAPRDLGSEQLVFELLKDDTLATYRQLTFTINVDPERREQRPLPTNSSASVFDPAIVTLFWSPILNRPSVMSLRQALELPSPTPPMLPLPDLLRPAASSVPASSVPASSVVVRIDEPLEENRAAY